MKLFANLSPILKIDSKGFEFATLPAEHNHFLFFLGNVSHCAAGLEQN